MIQGKVWIREIWFTSDTHFGHKNIIEYEKEERPFKTVEEMNETIIDRWNNVADKKDIVYHLGDVVFSRNDLHNVSRCNGSKRLVMGNHDCYSASLYLDFFDKLYGCIFYKQCLLSHIPVHYFGFRTRWLLNIHGHLHSKLVYKNQLEEE